MTTILQVQKRDASASRATLPEGHIPAVVYGPQQEAITISLDEFNFDKIRREASESTIINLEGLDADVEVLIKNVDFDPAKQVIRHADFYAIERGKDMTATVPFEFIGEAPAESGNIGTVTKTMMDIEVTSRPSNLPEQIEVNVEVLTDADSKITVADLPVLDGVTYNAEAEDPVAVVAVTKQEVDADPEPLDAAAVPEVTESEEESV